MHAYINTYTHSYIQISYRRGGSQDWRRGVGGILNTYIHTYIHTRTRIYTRNTKKHTYIHTCMHAYQHITTVHTHIHIYMHINRRGGSQDWRRCVGAIRRRVHDANGTTAWYYRFPRECGWGVSCTQGRVAGQALCRAQTLCCHGGRQTHPLQNW